MSPGIIAEYLGGIAPSPRRRPSGRTTWIAAAPVPASDGDNGGGEDPGPAAQAAQAQYGAVGDRPRAPGGRSLSSWHAPDAYAFGVICCELLTLQAPWKGLRSIEEIWRRVQSGERPSFTPGEAAAAPEGFVALMQELWDQDPLVRPSFAETLRRLRALPVKAPRAAMAPC